MGLNSKLELLGDEAYRDTGVELVIIPDNVVEAKVVVSELLGAETQLYTKVGNTELVSKVDQRDYAKPGNMVKMGFEMNKAHFFDPETEVAVEN